MSRRRFALLRIVENLRERAGEFPGLEERSPVDVRGDFAEIVRPEITQAEEFRLRRRVARPIEFQLVGARLLKR